MSRRARWVGSIVIALVGLGALAIASVDELRAALAFQLAPGWASRRTLARLEDDRGRRVTLVGTIHGAHLDTPAFGLAHLAALVDHAAPDLVLVESRAEELGRGNVCDGPVEMGFVTLRARARGVEVRGVDFWERGALGGQGRRSDDDREEAIARRVIEALGDRRATLVLTGFSHTPEIAARLRAQGFRDAPLDGDERARLLAPDGALAWPEGMAACLERRIAEDEAAIAVERDAAWRARLEANVAARRGMLARVRGGG